MDVREKDVAVLSDAHVYVLFYALSLLPRHPMTLNMARVRRGVIPACFLSVDDAAADTGGRYYF